MAVLLAAADQSFDQARCATPTNATLAGEVSLLYHHDVLALLLSQLLACAPSRVPQDAATVIRRVMDQQPRQQAAQSQFAYRTRTIKRNLRPDGSIIRATSETHAVTPSAGGDYVRLVARDGRALSGKNASKEERKLQRHRAEQLGLSAAERERRTKDHLNRRVDRYRDRLADALEVFHFEAMPDEVLDEQCVRVFRFQPKRGYRGHSRATKTLARMTGTVWIDAERDQLAKLHVRFRESLKFLGGVFGRVSRGSEAVATARLTGGQWMLDEIDVELVARLYFIKSYRQNIVVRYRDYQK